MEPHRSPSELSEALQPLLMGLRSRWVRDFLFTPSPIHINHLLSPSLSSTSVQLKTCVSNVLPPIELPPTTRVDVSCNTLLAPTINFEQETYGVGVIHNKIPEHSEHGGWLQKTTRNGESMLNLRFVLSTSSQSLLQVYHAPLDNTIIITVTHIVSVNKKNEYIYVLKYDELQQTLKHLAGDFTTAQIATSLLFVLEESHNSLCFFCGSNWTAPCHCKLSYERPLHPYDFTHFKRKLQPYTNTFEPGQRTIHYAFGTILKCISAAGRVSSIFVNDPSALKHLRCWSLSESPRDVNFIPGALRTEVFSNSETTAPQVEDQMDWDDEATVNQEVGLSAIPPSAENNASSSIPNSHILNNLLQYEKRDDQSAAAEISRRITSQPPDALSDLPGPKEAETGKDDFEIERLRLACDLLQDPALNYASVEKLNKAVRRKLRNRESARRSYAKQKALMTSLKTAVEREKEVARELRMYQQELITENFKLKTELKKVGTESSMLYLSPRRE